MRTPSSSTNRRPRRRQPRGRAAVPRALTTLLVPLGLVGWLTLSGQGCADDEETTQTSTPQPDGGQGGDAAVSFTRAPRSLILTAS